jgi:hypothetical protein
LACWATASSHTVRIRTLQRACDVSRVGLNTNLENGTHRSRPECPLWVESGHSGAFVEASS